MPTADSYMTQTFLNPAKKKPRVPGLATPRYTPPSLFAGRPTESMEDSDAALQGGLAGLVSQANPNPFNSTFLFKRRK